jgi:hypothetical protein
MPLHIGVDLGQTNDYTAVCIGQRVGGGEARVAGRRLELPDPAPWGLHVRHLERIRGLDYVRVADRLEGLLGRLTAPYELAVDATGVGLAVTDLLRERGLRFRAVTITGGDRETSEGRTHRVPKRDLVSGLQVLLQSGRLKIAAGLPDAETLRSELLAFRVKISASGHDSYEAWREKDHDDLVLAAALCAWAAGRGGGEVDEALAGTFGDPVPHRDLYRWEGEPRERGEWEQDNDVYPEQDFIW